MRARVILSRVLGGLRLELASELEGGSKAAAKAALREAVLGTPAAGGTARANWQVGRDNAPVAVLTAKDPDGLATIAKGEAVIDAGRAEERLLIVNNLDYIAGLNDGHAGAAPGGFAERAAAVARRI
jgi:hypothetical protein